MSITSAKVDVKTTQSLPFILPKRAFHGRTPRGFYAGGAFIAGVFLLMLWGITALTQLLFGGAPTGSRGWWLAVGLSVAALIVTVAALNRLTEAASEARNRDAAHSARKLKVPLAEWLESYLEDFDEVAYQLIRRGEVTLREDENAWAAVGLDLVRAPRSGALTLVVWERLSPTELTPAQEDYFTTLKRISPAESMDTVIEQAKEGLRRPQPRNAAAQEDK